MQHLPVPSDETSDVSVNLNEQLHKYLLHWKWIVAGALLSLSIAYIYLRYEVPQYGTTTTILIKDDKKGGVTEMDAFNDLFILGAKKSNLENEIEILKSRKLSQNVVSQLQLQVTYYTEGRILSPELYSKSPIEVYFTEAASNYQQKDTSFYYKPINKDSFQLLDVANENAKTYRYSDTIRTTLGPIQLLKKNRKSTTSGSILIRFRPVKSVANSFKNRLQVTNLGEKTSILQLTLVDPLPEKGSDYLNALVVQFNEDALADKNLIAKNTQEFINERLDIITEELTVVEKSAEAFKKDNRLTDLVSDAGLNLGTSSAYEKAIVENEKDLRVVDFMQAALKKNTYEETLPTNIIPSESSGSSNIQVYNQLVLERKKLLQSTSATHPSIVNYNQQLEGLKNIITESLQNLRSTLQITRSELAKQGQKYNSKVSEVPTLDRKYRSIDRQQNIKEALYLYLRQKQEETAISLAVTSPKAKVLDSPYGVGKVSPQSQKIYLIALLLGLLVPIGILYIITLLDTKIHTRNDVEKALSIPYLGDIPTSDEEKAIITSESRSAIAESFRIVLTNLEFMLAQVEEKRAKTIFVTSTIPKEGKTFISVNLASTLASYGKKVLLVGMDLRHPKIGQYIKLSNSTGVSNYLSSDKVALEAIQYKQKSYADFWVMPSGIIPPNPAELLNSKKITTLFDSLKEQYDYIIVDTAPVSLVTDTLLISKYADVVLYVIRANYLKKHSLDVPKSMSKQEKLPNMAVLLNGTDPVRSYGYGYGYGAYGYGVEVEQKSWIKRLFTK